MSRIPRVRQVRTTITLYPKHVVVTVAVRDGKDNFEWDRRQGTWDLPVHGESLTWETLQGAVDALIKALPDA